MKRRKKASFFDRKAFLSKVNAGAKLRDTITGKSGRLPARRRCGFCFLCPDRQSQGTVLSEQGKEAVVAVWEPATSSEKDASADKSYGWQRSPHWRTPRSRAYQKPRLSASSTKSRPLPSCSSHTFWHATAGSRKTWSINCSTRARNGWRERFCFWRISARKESLSRSWRKSVRRPRRRCIGTTRPRVSYFMNKFRRLGLINYNGQIEVHRSLLNVVLHETGIRS